MVYDNDFRDTDCIGFAGYAQGVGFSSPSRRGAFVRR